MLRVPRARRNRIVSVLTGVIMTMAVCKVAQAVCTDDTRKVDLELIRASATRPDSTGTAYITIDYKRSITDDGTFSEPTLKITKSQGGSTVHTASMPYVDVALGG